MLREIRIFWNSGLSLINCDCSTEIKQLTSVDNDYIASFLIAVSSFAETTLLGQIQEITLSNYKLLFVRNESVTIVLMSDYFDSNADLQRYREIESELIKQIPMNLHNIDKTKLINKDQAKQIIKLLKNIITPPGIVGETKKLKEIPPTQAAPRKIMIMGLAKAGKTSICNYFFKRMNTKKIETEVKPTLGKETSLVNSPFSSTKIVLQDLGGQTIYTKQYLAQENLFDGIDCLIYVIDIFNIDMIDNALGFLEQLANKLKIGNYNFPIFVFLHKFDPEHRKEVANKLFPLIKQFESALAPLTCYFELTSIYDNSIDEAMSKVLLYTIPIHILESILDERIFARAYIHFQPILSELNDISAKLPQEELIEKQSEYKRYLDAFTIKMGQELAKQLQKDLIKFYSEEKVINHLNTASDIVIERADKFLHVYYFFKQDFIVENPLLKDFPLNLLKGIGPHIGFPDVEINESHYKIGGFVCIKMSRN